MVIISSTNESTTPSSTHFTREMSDRVLVLTATATTQDIYAQEEDEDSLFFIFLFFIFFHFYAFFSIFLPSFSSFLCLAEDEFVICGFTQDQSEPPGIFLLFLLFSGFLPLSDPKYYILILFTKNIKKQREKEHLSMICGHF